MDKPSVVTGSEESAGATEQVSDRPRYTLVRSLGKGGTGEVHEALLHEANGTDRRIVVKVLAENAADEVGRLRRLVEITRGFDHPNINAPFEFIASSAGRVVLCDHLEGLSLIEVQRRLKRLGRPLPVALALEIVSQALEGLMFLHAPDRSGGLSSFIHRAIKPSNLFVGADGGVRILDIGLLTPLQDATLRGKGLAVVNVLPYMAPEQLAENPRLTPSTDLYSLGTVAYELLAGRLLFDGSAARRELEIRVGFGVQDKLRALESVVPGIAGVLTRALALTTNERYASAAEMFQAVGALRPEPQRDALSALVQELQALPALTVASRTSENSTVQNVELRPTLAREKLEAKTLTRAIEAPPASMLPGHKAGGDVRFKVGIGLLSLAIAFGALWWVDRNRQSDALDNRFSTDRALDDNQKATAEAEKPEANDGARAANTP